MSRSHLFYSALNFSAIENNADYVNTGWMYEQTSYKLCYIKKSSDGKTIYWYNGTTNKDNFPESYIWNRSGTIYHFTAMG